VEKQVNKVTVVLNGIAAAVPVSEYSIVGELLPGYSHGSQASKSNGVGYRLIRRSVCNHDIPFMIELTKVDIEVQLRILAISDETAEHFAAVRRLNCVAAIPGGGALPAQFSEVTSAISLFDRSGIIKLSAERLVSLEKAGAAMKAA